MKTKEESSQLDEFGRLVEDALIDACVKSGKRRNVEIKYDNENECFYMTIGDRELVVNVGADSVLTAARELIREACIYFTVGGK